MTSATDELRRMLDERGVKHEGGERSVRWRDRSGVMMQAFPLADGELGMDVWSCTPEQAIAATLGSSNCTNGERTNGTCHKVLDFDGAAWICSECGEHIGPRRWKFCPNCGRKVVDDG